MKIVRRKIGSIGLFVICVFLLSVDAFAIEDHQTISLNLAQAIQMALTRHADLIVANERVKQALANIQQNASPLLPQFKGIVSETRQTRDLRGVGLELFGSPLVGPFNVYDARLRLTQTIFDPSAMARFKASQQGHVVSVAQQKKIQEDVLVLVATLFIEAKRSQDRFFVEQSALRRDKKEISIIFSRFKSGLSSSMDMKKARAKYAHALYNFETAKKQALERKLDLLAALNLSFEQKIYFVWDDELFKKEIFVSSQTENQSDVRLASEQFKLSQKERQANQSDFWPKVSFLGEYGPNGMSPNSKDSSETYALGVTASIPIFEGGLRQANLKASENAVHISQTQWQSVKRNVEANLESQYAILSQAQFFVEENDKNIAVADEELQLARSKYQAGNASSLDLSLAEVDSQFAHDQKEEALSYYLLAKINLARLGADVEKFLLDKK